MKIFHKLLGSVSLLAAAVLVLSPPLFAQPVQRDPEVIRDQWHVLVVNGVRVGSSLTGPLIEASGTSVSVPGLVTTGSIVRTGQEYQVSGTPKVGATAGWVVAGATNLAEATLPASQTGSTMVLPVRGLKIAWTVTAFKCVAQIESAGGTVTFDANLRKLTNAAADPTDASLGSITQVSATADTAVASSHTLATPEVLAADEWLYLLITATTAASTDIRFLGCTVTVSEA